MATLIKNMINTTGLTCNCDSWLDHWVKYSGHTKPTICSVTRCSESPVVGAHVKKSTGGDTSSYIVPLCNKCNKSEDVLEVVRPLVSTTCR